MPSVLGSVKWQSRNKKERWLWCQTLAMPIEEAETSKFLRIHCPKSSQIMSSWPGRNSILRRDSIDARS